MNIVMHAQSNKPKPFSVKGTLEMPAQATVPAEGQTLYVRMGESPSRLVSFRITGISQVWEGEDVDLLCHAASHFEDLKYLAIVLNWEVTNGLNNLSKEQQGMIRCNRGECADAAHAH